MSSLTALAFNLVGSLSVFCVTMVAFGCALRSQNTFVAARCTARPPTVIYNPNRFKHPSQDRGSPMFGWIFWVMGLTYETMLRGVPGTGTRDGGLSGTLLKVNLDGIVLLRFHHLCLRVCCLACALYLLIVLPIYATAPCNYRNDGRESTEKCTKDTGYGRLTLDNIRVLKFEEDSSTFLEILSNWFLPLHGGTLARLYAVVFVTWVVTYYALRELKMEWGDVLAMRRVYYLEADHFADRKKELETTVKAVVKEKNERRRSTEHNPSVQTTTQEDESYLTERKPWIPHPEQLDTVPNIELYSVLVGGLPALPTEVVEQEEVEAIFSRKQCIDWQLSVTTAFFDHCVPNQPGFSSSIAAVTILPSAGHLTEAWNQWHRVAGKLRRLRFIRRKIKKRQAEIQSANLDIVQATAKAIQFKEGALQKPKPIDTNADEKEYHEEILGSTDDLQVESRLLYALHYGPEQTAAYSREFALGAANLAPYGWHEERVLNASLEELLVMEKSAVYQVHEANAALRRAQERIAEDSDEEVISIEEDISDEGDDSWDENPKYTRDENLRVQERRSEAHISTATSRSLSICSSSGTVSDEASFGIPNGGDDTYTKLKVDEVPKRTPLRKRSTSLGTSSTSSATEANGFKDITKTLMKVTGLDRSGSVVSTKKKERRRMLKADIHSATLPNDLGLEAGLWKENRSASLHRHSGHRSNSDKNALRNSMHATERREVKDSGRRSAPQRTQSSDSLEGVAASITAMCEEQHRRHIKRVQSYDSDDDMDVDDSMWSRLRDENECKQRIQDRLGSRKSPESTMQSTGCERVPGSQIQAYGDGEQDSHGKQWTQGHHANPTFQREHPHSPQNTVLQPGQHGDVHPIRQLMKKVNENESDADSSVDMEQLAATARAYSAGPAGGSDFHLPFPASQVEDNLRVAFDFEEKAGLRHRDVVGESEKTEHPIENDDKWARVMGIVQESSRDKNVRSETKERLISSGTWKLPSFLSLRNSMRWAWNSTIKSFRLRMKPPEIVDDLVRDSSYAVVTFTSRQGAVAARHCLADSRGHDRWVTVADLPSPPLADAPVMNVSSFRGCVRPVTLSISEKQKTVRHTLAIASLVGIYFFYTIPLVAAQRYVSPEQLSRILPGFERLEEKNVVLYNILSGFIPALVWTAFFAVCPPMFKIIANFGSNATSIVTAENSALSYFWWFMVLSAFTGTSLSTAVIEGFRGGLNIGAKLQDVIESTAAAIPVVVSATWLNWMIVRVFAVLPTQYLLQLNTFLFSCLGMRFCARAVRGGGAGGPVPYRIYVDSGVVLLCLFALAPASPLVAPAALAYFFFCTPMLRWTLIFLYRPKFDIGGGRFPFLFDICISGIIVGQIFLVAMMTLKRAVGPAVAAFCPIVPTIWFRHFVRRRYLRAFSDAALLQTSLLDGWDTNEETSEEKREEFRIFLVDCHKAAYVPVCIAGDTSTMLTAEPAVVVPVEFDEEFASVNGDEDEAPDIEASHRSCVSQKNTNAVTSRMEQQPGAMARRTSVMARRASAYIPTNMQNMPMLRRTRVQEVNGEWVSPLQRSKLELDASERLHSSLFLAAPPMTCPREDDENESVGAAYSADFHGRDQRYE